MFACYGDRVYGKDDGDGWIELDRLGMYLPINIRGKRILKPLSDDHLTVVNDSTAHEGEMASQRSCLHNARKASHSLADNSCELVDNCGLDTDEESDKRFFSRMAVYLQEYSQQMMPSNP